MVYKITGKSKGFGFITFVALDSVEKVLQLEHEIDGKKADSREIHPKKSNRLFIGNLAFTTSVETVRAYFEIYGKLTDVAIPKDPETGAPKGFGFITFEDEESVLKVMNSETSHVIDGRTRQGRALLARAVAQHKNVLQS